MRSCGARLLRQREDGVDDALRPDAVLRAAQPPETKDFAQQTMVRVKDPGTSLKFYTNARLQLVMFRDFPQWGFSVCVTQLTGPVPADEDARWDFCMRTPGCIELTWNHGRGRRRGLQHGQRRRDGHGDGEAVAGGFDRLGIPVPDVY